jgi:hypothetical protein
VASFAVSGGAAAGAKDRDRLKLAVAVYDGSAAAAAYAVDSVPRFAVIDAGGKVLWTFSGVGTETGFLLREQVDRLARPIPPDHPPGTTAVPGLAVPPIVPPP